MRKEETRCSAAAVKAVASNGVTNPASAPNSPKTRVEKSKKRKSSALRAEAARRSVAEGAAERPRSSLFGAGLGDNAFAGEGAEDAFCRQSEERKSTLASIALCGI